MTGELLVTEHGARGGDKLNRIVAVGNCRWPIVTVGIDYPCARISPFSKLEGYIEATLRWTPSIAPAGLAAYGGQLPPDWRGDLFVPALGERGIRRVRREGC